MTTIDCDVCVAGAGTAGMAAVYALKNRGWKVALVEKNSRLGGTAVNAWVEPWIEGINPPYLVEIFNSLSNAGKAWGNLDKSWLPPAFSKTGERGPLRFDPDALAQKYSRDINADGKITVLTGYSLSKVIKTDDGKKVSGIEVSNTGNNNDVIRINAKYYIDSSGDGVLCVKAGCKACVGEDAYEDFREDLMKGKTPKKIINEPSLFFKVEQQQKTAESGEIKNSAFNYDGYRDGSCINPMTGLGISGMEIINSGIDGVDKIYKKACSLIDDFWNFIKQEYQRRKAGGLPTYGYCGKDMDYIPTGEYAPMLGVRESYRIECDYMLRQSDLCVRIQSNALKDFIACGSHEIDLHEKGSLNAADIGKFNTNCLKPSGIPYGCLVPKMLDNVFIACRAYGASHIALSARRVNKDMAQLGWAAGHAVRLCLENNLGGTRKIDIKTLQGPAYTDFENSVKELEKRMK
jgi:hypothetical protein